MPILQPIPTHLKAPASVFHSYECNACEYPCRLTIVLPFHERFLTPEQCVLSRPGVTADWKQTHEGHPLDIDG